MGWTSDRPGHEGFIVGLVEVESAAGQGWTWWRELSMYAGDERRGAVERFQVGCECGWRSSVFIAPRGAEWSPYSTFIKDEQVEDAARALWRSHLDEPRPDPRWLRLAPEGR